MLTLLLYALTAAGFAAGLADLNQWDLNH